MSAAGESVTLEQLHQKLQCMEGLLQQVASVLQPAAQSRPLTAEQLMNRWAITGKTEQHRLDNLAKCCRQRGLKAMRGTRGLAATYMVADVLAAEAYANGTMKRRRAA